MSDINLTPVMRMDVGAGLEKLNEKAVTCEGVTASALPELSAPVVTTTGGHERVSTSAVALNAPRRMMTAAPYGVPQTTLHRQSRREPVERDVDTAVQ